ncbi:MAG: PA2778 family cysteine peptidase [Alcanivoracaceae bacterium]
MKIFLVVLALALCGCASRQPLQNYRLPVAQVELDETPFFPQQRYQCGPAALATVLVADGVTVTPDELALYVYLPERRGSLQVEMVAATRRYGRVPYVLRPRFDDLLAELASGKPVLVMLNLSVKLLPQWHYAVVIGYDVHSDSMLLRSGTTARLRMTRVRFQGAWSRAEQWAMVVVPPDEMPATVQSSDWLRSASAFEELGQTELVLQAYRAATRRWPELHLAWLALANALYGLHDLPGAESALRRALELEPSAAVHNNLAHVLNQRGCLAEAAAHIELAESMEDARLFPDGLKKTRLAIEANPGPQSSSCFPQYPDQYVKPEK